MPLSSWFVSRQREQPARVPTDTVVPLIELPPSHYCTIEVLFRFDAVLSPEKLRLSLAQLMEMGNWRQLGGRLRRRENDPKPYNFDLHVPVKFTPARPAFIYRTSAWEGSINDHPVAARIPRATDSISVHNVRDALAPLVVPTGFPKTTDDWIYSDNPGLFFEQINFHDATLILTMFPHHLMDATGYSIFLKAWTTILHGQRDIPLCRSFLDDPFCTLTMKTPPERYIWYKYLLNGLDSLVFTARFMWENLWAKEERLVCIPGQFLNQMRKDTLEALSKSQETPFVSESDVLNAWFSRLIVTVTNPSKRRSFALANAFDTRSTILDSRSHVAHIMNSVLFAYTILPISDVLARPVSFLAAEIRASLVRDRVAEQIEARIAWSKEVGRGPLIGTSDMFQCMVSNWSKGSFFSLDFSPAILEHRDPPRRATPCIPSGFLSTSRFTQRICNWGIILGKEAEGNWWMQWGLPRATWLKVEEHLQSINQNIICGKKM